MVAPRKPAIGNVPLGDTYNVLMLLKQNIDMLTGRTGGELKPISATGLTNAILVNTINEIIARLNASTN